MNIDWTITIAVFLIFVVWSINYYLSLFETAPMPLEKEADIVKDKIIEYLTVDGYRVPMKLNSTNTTNNAALFMNFTWPDSTKNSTRIFFANGTSLTCNIIGDVLYWQLNLTNITYDFVMRFANQSIDLRCNTSFTIANETKTIPQAMEKSRILSQDRINEMTSTGYGDFKNSLSITRDFRLEINISGNITNYGLNLPSIRNIFVKEYWNTIEETGEKTKVSVMTW